MKAAPARFVAAAAVLVAAGCIAGPVEPDFTAWEAELAGTAAYPLATGSVGALSDGNRRRTEVSVVLANAPPESTLSWRIRAGQCGADGVVLGAPVSYADLVTDETGNAARDIVLSQAMIAGATYAVEVRHGPDDAPLIACGALLQR
jgi:hypothetical protein